MSVLVGGVQPEQPAAGLTDPHHPIDRLQRQLRVTGSIGVVEHLTDRARELLIQRAGRTWSPSSYPGPDGRRYPFGQAVGSTDTDEIRRRADNLIYEVRACLHWHDDEARTAW